MKAIYFLLLILSFVTDVIAADITVTSDSSTSYILNVNDTLTINSGVNINSIGIPITVNDSIEINNYGNVTCSSSVQYCVTGDGSNITINNFGTLDYKAGGASGYAINIENNNTINNYGDIFNRRDYSAAIVIGSDSHITNYGNIVSDNSNYAAGIFGSSGQTIINEVGGNIITYGQFSAGISNGHSSTSINRGVIRTFGEAADGISSQVNGTIINAGSIYTIGRYAYGLDIDEYGNTVTNSGLIQTSGEYAGGIKLDGENANDANQLTMSGTIITSGNYADGIVIEDVGAGHTITVTGSISTAGQTASGINGKISESSIINIESGATITTTGLYANGISSGDNATITNAGQITSTGNGVELGLNNTLINSGSIATSGTMQHGISVDWNGANVNNSGTVQTSGDNSDALRLDMTSSHTYYNSGTYLTTGSNAHAIHLEGDNNTISNSGTLKATGTNSYAIYASGENNVITLNNNSNIFGDIYTTASSGDNSFILRGEITGGINNAGARTDITNSGNIDTITNTGTLTTLTNTGNIDTITNTGTLTTLTNTGNIDTITNTGTLTNFTNDEVVSHSGDLPVNYNLIINSASDYGKINFSVPEGVLTFSIDTNNSTSNLSGYYSNIFSGISNNYLAATSGSVGRQAWSIYESSPGSGIYGLNISYSGDQNLSSTISTSPDGAYGFWLANNNTNTIEINTEILTSGANASGLYLQNSNSNNIILSGIISSTGSGAYAIKLDNASDNNNVTINKNSLIIGGLHNDGSNNTLKLNLGAGRSYALETTGSSSWTIEDLNNRPMVTGSAYGIGVGNMETQGHEMYQRTYQINQTLQQRQLANYKGNASPYWINSYYNESSRSGSSNLSSNNLQFSNHRSGINLGYRVTKYEQPFELLFNYENSSMNHDDFNHQISSDSMMAGVFIPKIKQLVGGDLSVNAMLGISDFRGNRKVMTNSSGYSGMRTIGSDYQAKHYVVGVGWLRELFKGEMLQTFLNIGADINHQRMESYREEAYYKFDSRDITQLQTRMTLATDVQPFNNQLNINVNLGVENRNIIAGTQQGLYLNNTKTGYSHMNQTNTYLTSSLNISYPLTNTISAYAGYQYFDSGDDIKMSSGQIGVSGSF